MEGVGRVSEAGAGEVGVCEVWSVNNAIPIWSVFRAKDYLPKLTVVYFLRVRRGTSQH